MSDNKQINFKMPELGIYSKYPNMLMMLRAEEDSRITKKAMKERYQEKEEKEREEIRRHSELISALKTAGESGATIVIGDNANGIQIQQNTNHSYQRFTNDQTFDYKKVGEVLNNIYEYTEMPQFSNTFKENSDNVKTIIRDTIKEVEQKGDVSLIKKSLQVIKELTVGAVGSLIATGILGLLAGIGV